MINKKILFIILLFGIGLNIFANEKETVLAPGLVKGFVIDSRSNQPMEFTTVALWQVSDSSLITGAITDITGLFRLRDVPHGKYYLEISFMGYENLKTDGFELNIQQPSYDAGRLLLSPTDATLNEVVVVADRPTMTYRIDKKVINVSQLHTSASGSAVQVLENIPSITVSIEGDVSLRGSSSFTVLIDGKPSILAANDILNQIPASQIENIEIITNPSARFDPDGVAGIINIVMKKNIQQGMNGVLNLSAGTPGRYGGDLLLNYRKERFNFFFGADYNKRKFLGQSLRINETYQEDLTSFLNSDGDFTRQGTSLGLRGGMDFTISPSSSLSVGYRLGDRERGSGSDRFYEEWTSQNQNRSAYSSLEDNVRGGFSNSLSFDYKLDFNQEGHGILAHLVLESSDSEDNSLNMLVNSQLDTISGQRSVEAGPSQELTFRVNYALPFSETQKLETGYQTSIDNSDESNVLRTFNPVTSNFELNNLFSKEVRYYLAVHSLYSTYSGTFNNLGYQFGLRAEYTDRLVDLLGEPNEFTLNQWDYYPTIHFSYDISDKQQTMASYTRRLQRLRGWYLEPFYTWDDAYNVRIGNPDLKPEYIDSYEVSYQYRFENGNVLSSDLYYRITNNKIERVRSIYDNQPNILLSSMANVGKDYSLGTELMMGFDFTKWWHMDLMTNVYDYRQEGQLNGRDYSASSFNWNARINNDFKITPSTRVQLRGMYNSPTVTAQGESTGYFVTDIAVKQDFMNRNLSLTFQVRDVFATASYETIYRDREFYNFSSWNPDSPFFSLSLSYKINNYSAERRGPEQRRDDMNGGEEF
jgi:outer membrane cobalamin receptor